MRTLVAGGAGAVNGVLLASAVVPPLIAIVACRVAWIWAKTSDERSRVSIGNVLRRSFWLDDKNGHAHVSTPPRETAEAEDT